MGLSASNRSLARRRLDERLVPVRAVVGPRPPSGWLRAVRDALGMSTSDMARRMGVSRSRITQAEHAEAAGNIKLSTLERAAEALGCEVVYAIVPRSGSLEELVQVQARRKAADRLARASHTMRLEDQETEGDALALDDLARDLVAKSNLWK